MLFVHFVENAVKHSSDSKGSYVNMKFKIVNQQLYFFAKIPNRLPLQKGILVDWDWKTSNGV